MNENLNKYISFLKILSKENNYLYSEEISSLEDMLYSNDFNIAVIGEFSVGKSTFLNAIMGKRILFSATREATGVSTRIINSNKKIARILFDDNQKVNDKVNDRVINLEENNAYEKLEVYLNREKSENQFVKGVEVEYPIEFIDRSVGILDTPGLGGLTGRELDIAKYTLSISNMSIIIIGNQGIKQSELDLLLGKNKSFGNITTKETVVVINKIGEFYDKYDFNTASIKIQKSKDYVAEKLKEHGLTNIKILAIDSKDYLWGKDANLYNLAKEKGMVKLSMEEYVKRSNFEELIEYISMITKSDSKEQILAAELKDKILTILLEFKNQYINNVSQSTTNIKEKINILTNRKTNLIENRRSILNSVKRQVNSSSIDFGDFIRNDIVTDMYDIKKYLIKEIDTIDNLNLFTKEKEKEILTSIDKIIDDKIIDYNKKIEKYKNMISDKVLDTFDKKVKLVLKSNTLDIKYQMNFDNIKNDEIKNIKKDYSFKEYYENETIMQLKEELNDEKHNLKELYEKKKKLNDEQLQYDEKTIKCKKEQNERRLQERINKLGSEPEKKPIYKKEEITTGILIWKKTTTFKKLVGFDSSECERWRKEKEKIFKEFRDTNKVLDKQIENLTDIDYKLKQKSREILICKKNIEAIKDRIKYATEMYERRIVKYENRMLDKAKTSLNEIILNEINKKLNYIDYQLESILNDLTKCINKEIETNGDLYLKEYEELLTIKYNKLIKILNNNDNVVTTQIDNIEKQIKALS